MQLIIQCVPNWYLHFQNVITREQKIVQRQIVCQKREESMLFSMISILFQSYIKQMALL